jgi:hypothetical protein
MSTNTRLPIWTGIALGVLLLIWVGLSGLLVVSRGDPETFLRTALAASSRPDAFNDLSRTMVSFWVVHTCLFLAALSTIWSRRPDVLAVLLIGPSIGLGIGVSSQQWSDPNWAVFVGVCLIGWLVGTLVGLVYWSARPGRRPA